MKRRRLERKLRGAGLVLAAVVVCAQVLTALGQEQAPPLTGTPVELEAYHLYSDNKLVSARTKAERALAADPSSIIGHYVVGCVMREAEGELGRAMYHLGRARELYENRYGTSRISGAPWGLHREILYSSQLTAGELEEYDYQLQLLDWYDSLYDPPLTAEHAWPLLHLRRFDEARHYAKRAIALDDAWQKSLGLNAMCAIEGEARTREPHYRACVAALDHARSGATAPADPHAQDGQQVAVHAYNAVLAAESTLRFDQARAFAEEGARRLEFTIANPHRLLARLDIDEGKMDDAIRDVREMQQWRQRQPAELRDQDRADGDATLATVLLAAGEADIAMRVITRALEQPDRRGLTTARPEQALGGHALLRRAIGYTGAELVRERRSRQGFAARLWGRAEAWWTRMNEWSDEERIANVLADEDRLVATLQIYVHGGIEPVPTWLVPDLVDVLGPGVVSVALEHARTDQRRLPGLKPYYDALEAEVAWADGDSSRALTLARRSLDQLPAHEALLKARVAVVGALAASDMDDMRTAYGLFERAMQLDPGVLRRRRIALPTTIRAHGTGLVEDAADMIGRSPRFDDDDHGFVLDVRGSNQHLNACLRSPLGSQLGCADITRERKETDDAFLTRFSEALHTQIFALRGTASSVDLRSLDGSTTGAREATHDDMRDVLRGLADP